MNVTGPINQQLQQDLQNELITANQLLRLISIEIQQLKSLTSAGGELEANVKENVSLIAKLANMQHISVENLPLMIRKQTTDAATNENQLAEQSSVRNEINMDES